MATRPVAIPNVPLTGDVATRHFHTALKNAIEERLNRLPSSLDRYATIRDLAEGGVPGFGGNTDSGDAGNTFSPLPPPAPTSVVVNTTWNNVIIDWTTVIPDNVAYTEVYRAEGVGAVLGDASPHGITVGYIYVDAGVEQGKTYTYWVRWVNYHGVPGPYHDPAGTSINVLIDPAEELKRLAGVVSEDLLTAQLNARVDNIDTPITGLIDGLANAITARILDVANVEDELADTQQRLVLTENRINTTSNGRTIEAIADKVDSVNSRMSLNFGAFDGAIEANQTAITGVEVTVDAQGDSITALSGTVTTHDTRLSLEEAASAAAVTRLDSAETRLDTAEGDIVSTASSLTALDSRVTTTESNTSANASGISGLETRVTTAEGNITSQSTDITSLQSTVNNLGGAGVNIVTFPYSDFEDAAIVFDGSAGVRSLAQSRIGDASLLINAATGNKYASLIADHSGYNILIKPNAKWILSAYVYHADKTAANARFALVTENGTTEASVVTGTIGTWTRESVIIDLTSDSAAELHVRIFNDSWVSGDTQNRLYIDGAMLEEQIGTATAASAYKQPFQDVTASAAFQALETRVTVTEGETTTNATDITALDSRVDSTDANVSANAAAVTSLDTRVTSTEGSITTQASQITTLNSEMDSAEADIVAGASATSALDTRVTSAEGTITTHSNQITTLNSEMDSAEAGISSNSSATSALDTRVTSAEGSITTNASDITALDVRVGDTEDGVNANATAAQALTARVTAAEGTISTHSSQITTLNNELDDAESDISANASATSALTTRVTAAEGTISTHSSQITTLNSEMDSAESDIAANSSATSALTTRVTAAEGTISTHSSDITSLDSRVTSNDGDITTQASATSALTTRVTTAENDIASAEATYTLKLDADGHIAGFGLLASSNTYDPGIHTQAIFSVDRFAIVDPDDNTLQFAVENGVVKMPGGQILNGSIGNAALGNAIIDSAKIIDAAVNSAKIQDAAVANAKIANAAITSAKIADANITNAKIADAAITNAKIQTAAVDTLQLAGQAVTIPTGYDFNYAQGYRSSPSYFYGTGGTWESGTIATTGAPVQILFMAYMSENWGGVDVTHRIKINGTVVFEERANLPRINVGPPTKTIGLALITGLPAGTFDWEWEVQSYNAQTNHWLVEEPGSMITFLETKR